MSETINFCRQLSRLLKIGVPIVKGLEIISAQSSKKFKKVLDGVIEEVSSGISFAECCSKQKKYFPEDIVSMISAGERAGFIEEALLEASKYLEGMSAFNSKIRSSLAYPAVVLIASIVSLAFIVLFVLPTFASIFEGMEWNIPPITVFMLNVSKFIGSNYIFIAIIPLLLLILTVKILRGARLEFLLFRTPVLCNIYRNIVISRICRMFGMLIGQGIPMLDALSILENCCTSFAYKKGIMLVREQVQVGIKIAQAFSDGNLFPCALVQMISVGEETGMLSEVLVEGADYYEAEMVKALKFITVIAEPAATIAVGAVVLAIVVSIFAPMTQIIAVI